MAIDPGAPGLPRRRDPPLDFDARIPRHWFAGSGFATHVANGINLLFPAGERFFVRAVRHYLDRLEADPELRAQVRGFFAQEGAHAREHERYFRVLAGQGYRVERFLALYERVAYGLIERAMPPAMRLSVTAALEHFTALLADDALRTRVLDHAHPTMRSLLLWHAAEEIEHKSVAFDVLARVHPSYALRVAGLAVGGTCLLAFWWAATATLLAQDRRAGRAVSRAEVSAVRAHAPLRRGVFLRGVREYVRRDFHPSQLDNAHLARDYLASAGL